MFSIDFLNRLREAELQSIVRELSPGARILEFGAGTGAQARRLVELGYNVIALDLASSGYAQARVFPVIDYDGKSIPLDDGSVDIIYSSNVLEHVQDFAAIAREFRRITKPRGYGVHLMPSVAWRAWTLATGVPSTVPIALAAMRHLFGAQTTSARVSLLKRDAKLFAGAVLPIGHGTSSEGISELWTFSARAWRRRFEDNGFGVERIAGTGLFHTGHQLLGPRLNMARRRDLAAILGSAANLYVVRCEAPGS